MKGYERAVPGFNLGFPFPALNSIDSMNHCIIPIAIPVAMSLPFSFPRKLQQFTPIILKCVVRGPTRDCLSLIAYPKVDFPISWGVYTLQKAQRLPTQLLAHSLSSGSIGLNCDLQALVTAKNISTNSGLSFESGPVAQHSDCSVDESHDPNTPKPAFPKPNNSINPKSRSPSLNLQLVPHLEP